MAKKKSGDGKKAKAAAPKPDGRMSWLDDESGAPLIHTYTERLKSFLEAMADGKIEAKELSCVPVCPALPGSGRGRSDPTCAALRQGRALRRSSAR